MLVLALLEKCTSLCCHIRHCGHKCVISWEPLWWAFLGHADYATLAQFCFTSNHIQCFCQTGEHQKGFFLAPCSDQDGGSPQWQKLFYVAGHAKRHTEDSGGSQYACAQGTNHLARSAPGESRKGRAGAMEGHRAGTTEECVRSAHNAQLITIYLVTFCFFLMRQSVLALVFFSKFEREIVHRAAWWSDIPVRTRGLCCGLRGRPPIPHPTPAKTGDSSNHYTIGEASCTALRWLSVLVFTWLHLLGEEGSLCFRRIETFHSGLFLVLQRNKKKWMCRGKRRCWKFSGFGETRFGVIIFFVFNKSVCRLKHSSQGNSRIWDEVATTDTTIPPCNTSCLFWMRGDIYIRYCVVCFQLCCSASHLWFDVTLWFFNILRQTLLCSLNYLLVGTSCFKFLFIYYFFCKRNRFKGKWRGLIQSGNLKSLWSATTPFLPSRQASVKSVWNQITNSTVSRAMKVQHVKRFVQSKCNFYGIHLVIVHKPVELLDSWCYPCFSCECE